MKASLDGVDLDPLRNDVIAGVVSFVSQYPWVLAIPVVLVILMRIARSGNTAQRDTKRLFTSQERRDASRRAGGRCEHKSPIWFRCRSNGAHGDHIYPWSRGGATRASNLQWLCARHNLRKSAHVPSRIYIYRLERRRKRYFPSDEDWRVDWRLIA